MDKVVITKSKVDSLADKIRAKAGTSGNMTIDQMGDVVEEIETPNLTMRTSTARVFKAEQNITITEVSE